MYRMSSRTDKLSSQGSQQSIQSISISQKKKSDNCYVAGRAIAKYSGIVCSTISAVSFTASIIFACISISYTYLPPVCFIAAIISLSTLALSIMALVAAGVSGVFVVVFEDKIQKFKLQQLGTP